MFADDIQRIIKNVTATNSNYEISGIETNDKGEGFLGKIFLVELTDKFSEKTWNIVIKFAFKDGKLRESVPIRQTFENEIYFYSVIFPALQDFRRRVGCVKEYSLVPKCYQTSLESEMESLVLENLKFKQFEVVEKKLDLSCEHFELLFKRYGYFHAQSLALKDQDFEKYSELVAPIKNVYELFLETSMFSVTIRTSCEEINKILIPGRDDDLIGKLQKYVRDFKRIFSETIQNSNRYSTILHGDCWSNNILFRHDKTSGKPTDLRLIDFQLMMVGSPVCDLSYALYSDASDSNLDNLDYYLQIYHNSLSTSLKKLGSDPEKLFPFNALKEEWKIYSKFGFLMGAILLRLKCTSSEDAADLGDFDYDSDASVFFKTKYDVDKYERKVYGLVKHMNEVGAL